jgi:hypothetical protein
VGFAGHGGNGDVAAEADDVPARSTSCSTRSDRPLDRGLPLSRPVIEMADTFRRQGLAWRHVNAGRVSLPRLKVMSTIESCRTATFGGHVERCDDCSHMRIAHNFCRYRNYSKCQAICGKQWLANRAASCCACPTGRRFWLVLPVMAQLQLKLTVAPKICWRSLLASSCLHSCMPAQIAPGAHRADKSSHDAKRLGEPKQANYNH